MGTHEVSLSINVQTFYEAEAILCITKHLDSHNCTNFLCCSDQAGMLETFNTQLLQCPSTTEPKKSWLVIWSSMLGFAGQFPSQYHAIEPSL